MTWVAAGVGGGTAVTGMLGASKAGKAQESAAKDAQRAQVPFLQRGYQGMSQLGELMGYDPTEWESRRMKRDIRMGSRDELRGMKGRDSKNAFIDAELQKKLDARKSGANYGFLSQRFGNEQFEKDPGYQFRLDEGNKAINSSMSARGGLLSGAALKALQKYGQGFASNEFNNAYNRYTNDQTNLYNRAAGLSGMAQQATDAMSAARMQQGDAQASRYMGMANAFAGGMEQGAGAFGMGGGMQIPSSNIGNYGPMKSGYR